MNETPLMHCKEDGNFLRFFWKNVKNNAKSLSSGREIYDRALYISIISPGQGHSSPDHEVDREFSDGTSRRNENIYRRYAKYIEDFKKNESGAAVVTGTPIDIWPEIDPQTAAKLRSINVFNVESLADLSDTGIQAIGMGGRSLVKKAREWIDAMAVKGDTAALVAENQAQAKKIEILESQLADLSARFDAMDEDKKSRLRRKDAA